MRVRLLRIAIGVLVAMALLVGGGFALLNTEWASRRVAREVEALLESRFDGRVEVETLSMSLFPRVAVTGTNLRVSREDEATPMLEIARFEVSGTPLELLRRAFSRVEVDGLQIYITRGRGQAKGMGGNLRHVREIRFGDVRVRNGRLVILPDDPRKLPLEFGLQEITLTRLQLRSVDGVRRAPGQPEAARADPDRGPLRTVGHGIATRDAGVGRLSVQRRRPRRHQGARRAPDVERQVRRRARADRRRRHDHQPRLPARSRRPARAAPHRVQGDRRRHARGRAARRRRRHAGRIAHPRPRLGVVHPGRQGAHRARSRSR